MGIYQKEIKLKLLEDFLEIHLKNNIQQMVFLDDKTEKIFYVDTWDIRDGVRYSKEGRGLAEKIVEKNREVLKGNHVIHELLELLIQYDQAMVNAGECLSDGAMNHHQCVFITRTREQIFASSLCVLYRDIINNYIKKEDD